MSFPLNSGAQEPLPYTNGIYLWVSFATFTSDSHVDPPRLQLGVLHDP
jgi:hypothetical protein